MRPHLHFNAFFLLGRIGRDHGNLQEVEVLVEALGGTGKIDFTKTKVTLD